MLPISLSGLSQNLPFFWDTNTEISEIKNKIAKSIENKGVLAIFYSYEFNG